jgi:hypothetical protein
MQRAASATAVQADVREHHLRSDVFTPHVAEASVQIHAARRIRSELELPVAFREIADPIGGGWDDLAIDFHVHVAVPALNEHGDVAPERLGEPIAQIRALADVSVRADRHIGVQRSVHQLITSRKPVFSVARYSDPHGHRCEAAPPGSAAVGLDRDATDFRAWKCAQLAVSVRRPTLRA